MDDDVDGSGSIYSVHSLLETEMTCMHWLEFDEGHVLH